MSLRKNLDDFVILDTALSARKNSFNFCRFCLHLVVKCLGISMGGGI